MKFIKTNKVASTMKTFAALMLLSIVATSIGCNAHIKNDVVRFTTNRYAQRLGSHDVIIAPCTPFSTTNVRYEKTPDGTTTHSYFCESANTKVVIRNNELTVNDKPYGTLNKWDKVEVYDGKVTITPRDETAHK